MAHFPYSFPINFAPTIAEVPDTHFDRVVTQDYQKNARKRIAEYLKDKPIYMALLNAFTTPAKEIEDTAFDFIERFWRDHARGHQLTLLGKMIGQQREGKDDYSMIRANAARVLINKSAGTVEEIYAIISAYAAEGAGDHLRVVTHPPKSFTIYMPGGVTSEDEAVDISRIIGQITDAGVNASFVYSKVAVGKTFTLDGSAGQGLDQGLLAGLEVVI
jgi:hypothetical protein